MEKSPDQIENRPAEALGDGVELKTDFLTEAQKQWLLRPQDRMHSDLSAVAVSLVGMGLARSVYCRETRDFGHVATPMGLAIRSTLTGASQ